MGDIWENNSFKLEGKLLIDYIYLESSERRKFAQSSHEYLIETVQINKIDLSSQSNLKNEIRFSTPSKGIDMGCSKKETIDNTFSTKKINSFNFSTYENDNDINPILRSIIEFNGYSRSNQECNYYNYYEPLYKHSNTPNVGINVYSFSLHPEQHQPSGSVNMSKLSNSVIEFIFNSNVFKYKSSDVFPHITKGSSSDFK